MRTLSSFFAVATLGGLLGWSSLANAAPLPEAPLPLTQQFDQLQTLDQAQKLERLEQFERLSPDEQAQRKRLIQTLEASAQQMDAETPATAETSANQQAKINAFNQQKESTRTEKLKLIEQLEKLDRLEKLASETQLKQPLSAARKQIKTELKKLDPNISIENISETPMPGVFMVTLQGGHILYSSTSGKHLLRGDMLEIRKEGLTNLTEEIKSGHNAKRLKSLSTDDMIVFAPKGKTKGVVYAFTDVDCGYCRKLHQEVTAMNDLGIELRYLAFPRGGERSPAYSKMVDAWCAKDRKQAMNDLKAGKPISSDISKDKKVCQAEIDQQYQLGMEMGVNGTPAMVLENGQLIPGYRPAADLAKMLKITI